MKYSAIYKCILCGQLIRNGQSHEVPYNELQGLLAKVIQNQRFAGNPYLYEAPMHVAHMCNDGSAGLAYFAGFMREGKP